MLPGTALALEPLRAAHGHQTKALPITPIAWHLLRVSTSQSCSKQSRYNGGVPPSRLAPVAKRTSPYQSWTCAPLTQIVRETHAKLLPHVPLAGWDVAITSSDPKVRPNGTKAALAHGL